MHILLSPIFIVIITITITLLYFALKFHSEINNLIYFEENITSVRMFLIDKNNEYPLLSKLLCIDTIDLMDDIRYTLYEFLNPESKIELEELIVSIQKNLSEIDLYITYADKKLKKNEYLLELKKIKIENKAIYKSLVNPEKKNKRIILLRDNLKNK